MPKKAITTEHEKEIRSMGATMTAKQIAKELKLNYTTVVSFMNTRMIARKLGKNPRVPESRRERNSRGIFNVDAVENWLV